ncbi:secreted antigen 1 [Babesia divergens]|uniref:Secreted antigen 1 n=1 Tax=Babesia divergens TaxID=32595 RepID=A0AAD9GHD9_BABDI|nr:secreted antigen 1 [Babesia divergens]
MKFLGILRASALFILVSAFHGPRGVFCSNLKVDPSNESFTVEVSEISEISENLKDSTVESPLVEKPSQEPSSKSSVPAAKSVFAFENPSWDDSKLASAVLFLQEFCKEVKAEKFNGKVPEGLSKACVNVSSTLDSLTQHFTPTYGPSRLTERNEIPMDLYEGILKPEDFKDYVKWLVGNIQNIIKSFKKMLEESAKLTEKELTKSDSVGPLKYGFVYKSSKQWIQWIQWIQWTAIPLPPWLRNYCVDLKGVTSDIISSLKRLHSQLKRVL